MALAVIAVGAKELKHHPEKGTAEWYKANAQVNVDLLVYSIGHSESSMPVDTTQKIE